MQTAVTFKNLEPSDNLRDYIQEKLDRFDKFLENPAEASVVLTVEKFRHIAEANISGDGLTINGKEDTEDMYSAVDMVIDKLEKQIKKNKEKNRGHRSAGKKRGDRLQEPESDLTEPPAEVLIQNIEYKPMDVDEALLQMDIIEDNFLVFTNARTDRVNVLYRRKDGHFGLIQPNR